MEYAKKTPFDKQINWASVSTEVADKALEIGQKRKDRKIALDQQMADIELQLANQKAFKTESVVSKWGDMSGNVRDVIFQANKDLKSRKITEADYKKIVGNSSEYVKAISETANTLDADIQAYIARQTPDEKGVKQGGEYELEMLNRFGKLADFKNKTFSVLPDGRISIDSVDEKGNTVSSLDLMSMNKAENRYAPRVDVDAETSVVVKDWEQWTDFKDLGRGAWSSVEDMRQNPYIGPALYKAVKSINNTPKRTLGTLLDYGVIKEPLYAYNDAESKTVKDKAVADLVKMREEMGVSTTVTQKDLDEIDNRIIRVDPTTADPILTEAQKKIANETVEGLIQMKMGREEKGGAKQDWYHAPVKTDGGGGYKQEDINRGVELFKLTKNAFEQSKPGDNSKTNEYLNAAGIKAGKFLLKTKLSSSVYGIKVYDYVKDRDGKPTQEVDWSTAREYTQGKSLASAITGLDVDEANSYWEIGNQYKDQIESTPIKKTESTKTKKDSQKFDSGKEANIKATMKANPGASRADVVKALGY